MGHLRAVLRGGCLRGDKSSVEARLEQSGEINTLQRFRLVEHWDEDKAGPANISHKLLFVEEDLREVVQEAISGLDALNKKAKDAKEKLDDLNVKYWILAQKWWHCRSLLQDGSN
ncbi:hypothetical protein N7530_004354 [Penicillium desertorum]|uniref:Uncharacterized protein n=1 Tax=Penicillium desertorum TaxID=1303715 RepID=A0A9W9WY39_9EURO|nr:hypothetical protein N7530_004354 [Penicillium desertorum]